MFSKVLVFFLLGASFVAANPVYNSEDVEAYKLRGALRESFHEWLADVKERLKDFLASGKENIDHILKKIKQDRIKITALTKNKIAEIGHRLPGIAEEIKIGFENHKDSWKGRIENLAKEGKSLVSSTFKGALQEINGGLTTFIEKSVKIGKVNVIELMDEIKKVLSEEEESEEINQMLKETEKFKQAVKEHKLSEEINITSNEQEKSDKTEQISNEQEQLEGKAHKIIEPEKDVPLISELAESTEPLNDVNLDEPQDELKTNFEHNDVKVESPIVEAGQDAGAPKEIEEDKLDDRLHEAVTEEPKQQVNPTKPKTETFNEDFVDTNDDFEEAGVEEKNEIEQSENKEVDGSDELEKVDLVNPDSKNSNESTNDSNETEVKHDSFLFEDQVIKEEKA